MGLRTAMFCSIQNISPYEQLPEQSPATVYSFFAATRIDASGAYAASNLVGARG